MSSAIRGFAARIGDWLAGGTRGITAGAVFVVLVLLALIVTPVAIGELAIAAHAHITEVVDPLDDQQEEIGRLAARLEASALRYVIGGNPEYLRGYEEAARDLDEAIQRARSLAERAGPRAVRQVGEVERAIRRWQAFAESVIALRRAGRAEEAQAAVATGEGAQLFDDFWRQHAALHDLVVADRTTDRERIDRILGSGIAVSAVLGVFGVLAALGAYRLARRTAELYEEVRVERARVAELATSERRRADELDAIIEHMAEGVTVVDASGQIVHLNRAARQIWQLSWPDEQHGHVGELGGFDVRYPDGRPVPVEELPINRVLRGESFSGLEVVYVRRDGRRYYLRFGGSAVRDEAGRVALAVTVYHDVTEIRALERQREEFVSVVAHDLRSPLTIIRGYASLLSRLTPHQHDCEQERKAVGAIDASARQLDRMVADLLDASRIEARRLTLVREEIDLPSFVRGVVERSAKLTEGHPVRVEVSGPVPAVRADPTRLGQILANLLSNAAKYSYPETEILVELEPRPGEVVVAVTNRGSGIPEEDRAQLFERFHRTRAAVAERVPGLGLGLYITKGLVEAHGGRIRVESEVGRYTTFRFTLPTG